MTLREIIYFISDELKLTSDDSIFNEEHIKFLINKYRVLLLNQQNQKNPNLINSSINYQTIKINLTEYKDSKLFGCDRTFKKSTEEIPTLINFNNARVYPSGSYCNYTMPLISKDRMRFIGFNKWLKNIIYCTINNNYLYAYSVNTNIEDLEEVEIQGIFEDIEKACSLSGNTDDVLDMQYPLDASLVPLLIQSVVQELLPKTTIPEDSYNNAADDKANIANYIARNQK